MKGVYDSMLNKKTVDDLKDLKGKKVLVRCDFNVPLQDGVITDENRIVAALPTIQKLIKDGAKVILCSHMGKPKGEPKPELSLAPVAKRLSEKLGKEVVFAKDETAKHLDGAIWQTSLQYGTKYRTVEEMEETSVNWLKMLGLQGDESLEELRAMDAQFFMGKETEYGKAPQGMVYDNYAIQYPTLQEAYEAGNFENVSILAGTDLGEFTQDRFADLNTAEAFYAYYKDMLGEELYEKYDFPHTCRVVDAIADDTARIFNHSVFTVTNNMLFGKKAEEYHTGDVYIYLFTHFTPGRNEEELWAWHSSELWYTFGSLRDTAGQRYWEDWDYELADIVTSYWSNFMKTCNPNGEGLPEWVNSNSEHLAYMDLGDEDTIGSVTYMDSLKQMAAEFYAPNYGF